MKFPSYLYSDDKQFEAEAHKYLVNVFQSTTYDPEIVRKLASMEEKALNDVLGKLNTDERKTFLKALDSAADRNVTERILSNASDALSVGFKNAKAQNSHLLDAILFGGSIGILPVALLYAVSEDMPLLAKIPYMAVMLPIAAAILVAEAVIAAAVFLAVSPVMSAWGVVTGIRAHYKAQNSNISEDYQSLKDKSHARLDEHNQDPIAQVDLSQIDKKQTDKSSSFLSSLINYLAVQPGSKPGGAHRFFAVSSTEGDQARKDIDNMKPWPDNAKPSVF
jgi:hypothetical protein